MTCDGAAASTVLCTVSIEQQVKVNKTGRANCKTLRTVIFIVIVIRESLRDGKEKVLNKDPVLKVVTH